ncbi:M24 family metallopeptidase, partial [uncultured Helicobacter sp.]
MKKVTPPHTYLIFDENAQYYECGFSCDNALILRVGEECYFITDSRYTLEAKQHSYASEVIESTDFIQSTQAILQKLRVKNIIFNPRELNLAFYDRLKLALDKIDCALEPRDNFHQLLRIKKTPKEIALVAKSQKLNKKAFKHFAKYIGKMFKKSPSEKQLHYQAMQFLSCFGEYDLSFEPIVGINANGAKPHALPSPKCFLTKNDILLFDAGIKYKRYCSDMTRTAAIRDEVHFSKKQYFKDKFMQKIYD